MNKPIVYTAGPISGLTYAQGASWRDEARSLLPSWIGVSTPLRNKEFLSNLGKLEQSYDLSPLSTDRGITTRDRNDVFTASAILMNLLGAERISVGTMIELGWADARRVPVVCVMEPGNPHDHPMLRELVGFRADTLEKGCQLITSLLLPYEPDTCWNNTSSFGPQLVG